MLFNPHPFFSLLSFLWLLNFEHFRGYEYCIASTVNMIGFLPLSPLPPSLSLCLHLYRGGSLEKDKAVSSSIVSSVQSKITQVLFFAFIPKYVPPLLYSWMNASTEWSLFPSCKEDERKVVYSIDKNMTLYKQFPYFIPLLCFFLYIMPCFRAHVDSTLFANS